MFRLGIATLVIGGFLLLAGCYRTAVLLSRGDVKALVPIAIDAPLAGELLALLGLVVCAAAVVLLGAARRRRS